VLNQGTFAASDLIRPMSGMAWKNRGERLKSPLRKWGRSERGEFSKKEEETKNYLVGNGRRDS